MILALGSSAPSRPFGSYLAGLAVKRIGLYNMMLVPAVTLMICLAIVRAVNARAIKDAVQKKRDEAPPGGSGGLSMIVSQRYLLLIALIILLLNLINTNGEYILDRTLEAVQEQRKVRRPPPHWSGSASSRPTTSPGPTSSARSSSSSSPRG